MEDHKILNVEDVYNKTVSALKNQKLPIVKAEYSAQQMGSWWIVTNLNKSLLRAVWNSRDRWVVIQSMEDQMRDGQYVWRDEWVIKRAENLTPEDISDRFVKIYKKLKQ